MTGHAVLLLALTISAQAAAAGDVDRLDAEAKQLWEEKRHEAALAKFELAYTLDPSPYFLAQRGLVEEKLERWVASEEHLAAALKSQHPKIEPFRSILETKLLQVRSRIGDLVIEGEPAGAEVWVGGIWRGVLPLRTSLRVAAGRAEVQVNAPGYAHKAQTVVVPAAQRARVDIRLEKLPITELPGLGPEPTAAAPFLSRWVGVGSMVAGTAALATGAWWFLRDTTCPRPNPNYTCLGTGKPPAPGVALLLGGAVMVGGGIWLTVSGRGATQLGLAGRF
jgi:hypothetical protein